MDNTRAHKYENTRQKQISENVKWIRNHNEKNAPPNKTQYYEPVKISVTKPQEVLNLFSKVTSFQTPGKKQNTTAPFTALYENALRHNLLKDLLYTSVLQGNGQLKADISNSCFRSTREDSHDNLHKVSLDNIPMKNIKVKEVLSKFIKVNKSGGVEMKKTELFVGPRSKLNNGNPYQIINRQWVYKSSPESDDTGTVIKINACKKYANKSMNTSLCGIARLRHLANQSKINENNIKHTKKKGEKVSDEWNTSIKDRIKQFNSKQLYK